MKSITKTPVSFEQLNEMTKSSLKSEIKAYTELTDGWFNAAYKIETESGIKSVLKIAPPKEILVMDYEKDIMSTEVEVMRRLYKNTDIPVPEIFSYDTSGKIIPQEYFFMQELEGRPYNYVKEETNDEYKKAVEESLGTYCRSMHSTTADKFGFYAQCHKKYDSWYECFLSIIETLLKNGEHFNVDIGIPYEKVIDEVKNVKEVLDCVKTPRLVHWDLWEGNYFVHEGRITGIIDFERALWGDNLMECIFFAEGGENFIKGYGLKEEDLKYYGVRTGLYGYYLSLLMVIECPYRQFEGDDGWKMDNLSKTHEKFLESVRNI